MQARRLFRAVTGLRRGRMSPIAGPSLRTDLTFKAGGDLNVSVRR